MGDEDLLDIIGNSKNVQKIQKHFRKMFAGIAAIMLSEDDNKILGNMIVIFGKLKDYFW